MEEGLTTNLRIELEKTNHVFQKWTSDYNNWLGKQEQDYARAMEEVDATLQALRTTDQQLEESRALNDAIKQQQRKEIQQAHQQVEGYQRQLASLQQLCSTPSSQRLDEQASHSIHEGADVICLVQRLQELRDL